MGQKIQVKRGLKADLPTLSDGEFGFCTDTNELYIGTVNGNVLANSAGSSSGGGGNGVNEYSTPETYGAKADGTTDDTSAIQQAIDAKLEVRLYGNHYKIAGTLYTRNGTRLIFGDNTIIERTGSNKFIMNSNPNNGDPIGAKYNKGKLTVVGGIFKNSATTTNTLVSLVHGDGILFERCTFLNTIDSHTLDIGGCKNVVIRDCKFKGYYLSPSNTEDFREAIQIDYATSFGMPDSFSSYDSTPSQNVLVENCYFGPNPDEPLFNRGFQAAVGTHTSVIGIKSSNITIRNNIIEDARKYGIRWYGWDNVLVENNIVITNAQSDSPAIWARITDTPYTTAGVKISSDPTQATSASNVQIRGNFINGPFTNGIRINNLPNTVITTTEKTKTASTPSGSDNMKYSDITIDGNIVENVIYEGVYATDSKYITIEKNKVKECGYEGIFGAYLQDAVVTENDVYNIGKTPVNVGTTKSDGTMGTADTNPDNGRGIYVVYSDRLTVNNNKIFKSGNDNIGLVYCNSTVINGNNCDTAGTTGFGVGIYVRNTNGVNINNNLINNAWCHGIDVRIATTRGIIQGNVINRCGVRNGSGATSANYGVYVSDNTEDILVMNNMLYTSTGDKIAYAVYATTSCARTKAFNNHAFNISTTTDTTTQTTTQTFTNIATNLPTPTTPGETPSFDGFVISKPDGSEMYYMTVNANGQLVLTPMINPVSATNTTGNPVITFTGA